MSGTPNYASTVLVGSARLTTGDASRTAPSAAQTLVTAGALGAQIERVTVVPLATTTKTVVRIFRHDGTTFRLYCEVQIPAQTITGTDAVIPLTLEAVNYPNLFPILLAATRDLRVTVNDTQTGIEVTAEGGSF